LRRKTALDDAVPSANAMAMMAYTALSKADPEDKKYLGMAKAIGACFARLANLQPVEHLSIITASMRLKNINKEERVTADEKNGE
jgi:uncharacterized protein YyaL (SSP411 family)